MTLRTCTRDGWSVGTTQSSNHPRGYAVSRFDVCKFPKGLGGPIRKGDHDGREFDSCEAASAFALERGYTQRFVVDRISTFKRCNRKTIRNVTRAMVAAIRVAETRDELPIISAFVDGCLSSAAFVGGELSRLDRMRFTHHVYTVARTLRPELFPEMARIRG